MHVGVLAQMEFPASIELTRDYQVWIADTGATNHSTPNDRGCTNKRTSEVTAQGAHGPGVRPDCEMDIPSTVCDKYGNELMDFMMTNVVHMSYGNYNLFSVT